jgi:phosphoribosylanthranilate isomerase
MSANNLVNPNHSAQIKICGLTRREDAELARSLGAWALGFIFYSKSPRFILPARVKEILKSFEGKSLSSQAIKTVGVFVNPTLDELSEVVTLSGINTIQLHGNESVELIESVRKKFPAHLIIKAFRLEQYVADFPSDYQLLDSASNDAWGGTGLTVDWKKAANLRHPSLILAGGLNAENIAQAIAAVKPFAVDVSSGVESAPGIKSEQKLKSFFEAAKGNCRVTSS